MTPLIVTDQLTKRYGEMFALRGCTMTIEAGETFGLLGPNGAGKTTLLRIIMGFLKPTSGSARVAELDCHADSVRVHELVSYLPGDPRLFPSWRGEQVLRFFADIHPRGDVERSLALAKRLELDLTRKVAYCSTGMRQKLAFALTMANDTPVVILDEPTANLDPTVRLEVLALVREARTAGRTIIFSSHVFSEAEQTCNRVAILRSGELVHVQKMSELHRQHQVSASLSGELPPIPVQLAARITTLESSPGRIQWMVDGELPPVLGWLSSLPIFDVRIEPVGLSVVYEKVHGRSDR